MTNEKPKKVSKSYTIKSFEGNINKFKNWFYISEVEHQQLHEILWRIKQQYSDELWNKNGSH